MSGEGVFFCVKFWAEALVTVRASQDPGLWSGARYLSLSNVARPKRAYLTWPDRSALI